MSEEIVRQQTPLAEFGGGANRLRTSLNLDDPKQRQRMVATFNDCDAQITEIIGQKIMVTDYVLHDAQFRGKTDGEMVAGIRLVLIDKDGLTYQTTGETLLRSFQRIVYGWGEPPWTTPLGLTPRTKKKGERSIYWFDVG